MGFTKRYPVRITKEEFDRLGGFTNPKVYRRMKGGKWTYWRV